MNYLDRLSRIVPEAAVPIAAHFAALGGGTFHPLALDGSTAADIHRITREFADVLQRHAEAHSSASAMPGDYSVKEAQDQIVELDEMVAAAMQFRATLLRKANPRA